MPVSPPTFRCSYCKREGSTAKSLCWSHGVWLRVTLPAIWRSNWGKRLGSV
ncbi:Uncharacterised protein [Vibrio cholerae]|nr:Uncharacterised protein [Vibrio cholerae]